MPRPASRARLALLGLLTGAFACQGSEIVGIGEFGRPIDGVQDQSLLPRLLIALDQDDDNCETLEGVCSSICDQLEPASCPVDACAPVLVDSGSPVTIMPKSSFALRDRCLALRQGHVRTSVGQEAPSTDGTVNRFRFLNVPTVDAPGDNAGGWEWDAGVYAEGDAASNLTGRIDVGGVLGGNLLKHFAVRLTELDDHRSVTFYEQFPGSEAALADQGFAFLRLQFPGRLLGERVNDRCAFGDGVACEVDELAVGDNRDDLTFEASRMVLDACIAPPPCAPLWELQSSLGNRGCRLRPGKIQSAAESNRECSDATDPSDGGLGASFVVSTGIPGVVMFEDSARRMFGELSELADCSGGEVLSAGVRACREETQVDLYPPGYPAQFELSQIRVRSLAFVAGHTQPSADPPCARLQARLEAAELSCEGLDTLERPYAPNPGTSASIDPEEHIVRLGENYWLAGQTEADPEQWIAVTLLPADSSVAMNIRREVGTNAVEPDGLIGSALLDDTDVVLDYTESIEKPGVRVACLKPGDPGCLSYPACTSTDPRVGDSAPGRRSCCWGMPDELLRDVLSRQGNDAADCCLTLSPGALAEVQAAGGCPDVPPPAGIGGIIP